MNRNRINSFTAVEVRERQIKKGVRYLRGNSWRESNAGRCVQGWSVSEAAARSPEQLYRRLRKRRLSATGMWLLVPPPPALRFICYLDYRSTELAFQNFFLFFFSFFFFFSLSLLQFPFRPVSPPMMMLPLEQTYYCGSPLAIRYAVVPEMFWEEEVFWYLMES